ncbi:MAG: beta-lactamase family protein [Steroidobacteraceae bacterium]|nr:beta-lactamase family protein [Steroidobacteraceae bacterium]
MKNPRFLALAALAVLVGFGSSTTASETSPMIRLDGAKLTAEAIDREVNALMSTAEVVGLQLALIHDGRVSYENVYGLRDAARKLPMTRVTVTYGASLTKAAFAYLVMQLVDEKRIDLDTPIADYLPKPLPEYRRYAELGRDARWRQLTMRMLLSHTTGFANFRFLEPDKKLKFHRDPGLRYGYSGEGIVLAQFVLETGLGIDVGTEMQKRIFDRFGMKRSSMTWRADFAANYAENHQLDGKPYPHRRWEAAGAAGSLDTTAVDYAAFLAAVVRGEGLSEKAKAEMIRRQIDIDSERQFPTLTEARTGRWKPIQLGYGLGWGVFETPYGHAFFKEGHDEGTANYVLCVQPRQACIVMLANDVRAEKIFVPLVRRLFGEVNLPADWEGFADAR